MINSEDYKEPTCLLCDGKNFYNPNIDKPDGTIPVKRIIEKIDALFNKNDYQNAGKLLEYWKNEAKSLRDKNGELSIISELIGYSRKIGDKEKTIDYISQALEIIKMLEIENNVSCATIYLNIATGFNAFGFTKDAIFYYEKTLKIYSEKLNKNDILFAGLYNNMALALVENNDTIKAEKYYNMAIETLKNNENQQPDLAITYINLAYLYEKTNADKNKIIDCLFNAHSLLFDEKTVQNGYLAYVYSKCAPAFEYFGYNTIANELKTKSGELYERN